MDNPIEKVFNRIDTYGNRVIDLQTRMTAIPAMGPENGGDGELEKSDYIKTVLEQMKCDELIVLEAPDKRVSSGKRPNLLARFKGESSRRTLWIMSHMDVVPPGDIGLWETDPFTMVEKDGKLYGRGTEDDQQGIVSSLLTVQALQEENCIPACDIGLAIVADEEAGSKYGIEYVLKKRPDLFRPDDLIIIPDAGDEKGAMIEVAEKSILWFKCVVQGKQTHGSTPEKGINAHNAAAHLIVRLKSLYAAFPKSDALFDPPISTFEPTKRDANVDNINTIPGTDTFYFDCRILPDYPLETVKRRILDLAGEIESEFSVTISLTYPQCEEAPPPTPADTPAAEALKKAVREVSGVSAYTIGIGGGTVAAYFRKAGLPAVCWCKLDDTLHAPNEYCRVANVLHDAKVFAHIALQR